jgi:hypothetical protein
VPFGSLRSGAADERGSSRMLNAVILSAAKDLRCPPGIDRCAVESPEILRSLTLAQDDSRRAVSASIRVDPRRRF